MTTPDSKTGGIDTSAENTDVQKTHATDVAEQAATGRVVGIITKERKKLPPLGGCWDANRGFNR